MTKEQPVKEVYFIKPIHLDVRTTTERIVLTNSQYKDVALVVVGEFLEIRFKDSDSPIRVPLTSVLQVR